MIAQMSDQRARATLELEAGRSSPVGALITGEGERLAFSGWAELGATVEEWRTRLPAGGAGTEDPAGRRRRDQRPDVTQ
jgi:hypothetical protein